MDEDSCCCDDCCSSSPRKNDRIVHFAVQMESSSSCQRHRNKEVLFFARRTLLLVNSNSSIVHGTRPSAATSITDIYQRLLVRPAMLVLLPLAPLQTTTCVSSWRNSACRLSNCFFFSPASSNVLGSNLFPQQGQQMIYHFRSRHGSSTTRGILFSTTTSSSTASFCLSVPVLLAIPLVVRSIHSSC